jgi:hypothetical protein
LPVAQDSSVPRALCDLDDLSDLGQQSDNNRIIDLSHLGYQASTKQECLKIRKVDDSLQTAQRASSMNVPEKHSILSSINHHPRDEETLSPFSTFSDSTLRQLPDRNWKPEAQLPDQVLSNGFPYSGFIIPDSRFRIQADFFPDSGSEIRTQSEHDSSDSRMSSSGMTRSTPRSEDRATHSQSFSNNFQSKIFSEQNTPIQNSNAYSSQSYRQMTTNQDLSWNNFNKSLVNECTFPSVKPQPFQHQPFVQVQPESNLPFNLDNYHDHRREDPSMVFLSLRSQLSTILDAFTLITGRLNLNSSLGQELILNHQRQRPMQKSTLISQLSMIASTLTEFAGVYLSPNLPLIF